MSSISFLHSPGEFFDELISLANSAKRRIVIATLYVGTGEREQRWLSTINAAGVPTKILLDANRGNRGGDISSVSVIKKLVPHAVIFQFVSPLFRGLWRILPQRAKECVGTQHMKFVLVDDTVIVTGANLSETYFTDRQDRYLVVRDCAQLAEFLVKQVEAMQGVKGVERTFQDLLPSTSLSVSRQRGYLCGGEDDGVTNRILEKYFQPNTSITLSSPYLNLSASVLGRLAKFADVSIVTGARATNAFHNSKGLSRFIPEAYEILKQDLLSAYPQFKLFEYSRPNWSFHPKGIWVTRQGEVHATVIGSSNFGQRSHYRDSEINFMLETENEALRRAMKREIDEIMLHSKRVYHTPNSPRWLQWLVRGPLRTFL